MLNNREKRPTAPIMDDTFEKCVKYCYNSPSMKTKQKKNFWLLVVIGAGYFVLMLFPNMFMRGSDNPLVYMHTDEYVVYPSLEKMFRFGPTLSTAWGRIIIHGEYHYGYPFFFFSFLLLLPFRLIEGAAFFTHTQRNIFLLRQFICVLPMILTAGVMTYVVTELRKTWQAVFTFLLILTLPAVVGNVTQWWHPDALMLLAVSLTFLCLKLDRQRLGSYFYLAAASCGMAASIKLMGFFFFLAIPLYIVIVWRVKQLPIKKAVRAAVGFVLVMALVIVFSNPFLFYEGPRNDMLEIQAQKTEELRYGYDHEENMYYALGPQFWLWTLETSYGWPLFPLLLLLMLAVSAAVQPDNVMRWVLLAWAVPIAIYLMWFVSPKPDHYLLPLMLPLYATALIGWNTLRGWWLAKQRWARWAAYAGSIVWAGLLLYQFMWNISETYALYLERFVVG